MEWKKTFDRLMDQLYNHPEEMRYRLLGKYDSPTMKVSAAEGNTSGGMISSAQRA